MNESREQTGETGGNVTMADVARVAGVSLKSVSRVINHEPYVSRRLREKVEAAVAELNYVPDTAARSLAGGRSFTLSIMFDNPSPNYTVKMLGGAYEACRARGYHLRIDNLESSSEPARLVEQVEAMLRNSRADGFVITPPLTDNLAVLDRFDRGGVRYVRIAPASDHARSPSVSIDDAAAAAAVAQRFWDQGHRRFGILNGQPDHGASHSRRQGFIGRLGELAPDIVVTEAYGGFEFEGGIAGGRALLSGPRRPTAVFAANDDMAAGFMVACSEQGLKVSDDISVIGFDDSWMAMSVWPYLTTVFQPIEAMAAEAINLLLDRDETRPPYSARILDWHIVERASDGPKR